jgi:hypothetical protein
MIQMLKLIRNVSQKYTFDNFTWVMLHVSNKKTSVNIKLLKVIGCPNSVKIGHINAPKKIMIKSAHLSIIVNIIWPSTEFDTAFMTYVLPTKVKLSRFWYRELERLKTTDYTATLVLVHNGLVYYRKNTY